MKLALFLAFCSAFAAGLLASIVACRKRPTLADWSLASGLVALGVESLLAGWSLVTPSPDHMVYWQHWRLILLSLLPGVWLLFSLSYARGNYQEFLAKWKFTLIAAFAIPVGIVIYFSGRLILPAHRTAPGLPWTLPLSSPGIALHLLFLLAALCVLMNLECTFRATSGRTRWRTKYMLLGVAVLFCARAYSAGEVLVLGASDLSLQTINSGALLLASLLIGWSIMRINHAEVKVYPSCFGSPQYDYRTIWRAFTEGTARHLEVSDLCRAVVKVVSELFQASSVTIWLLDERQEKLVFAASTEANKATANRTQLEPAQTQVLMSALREHPGPMDVGRCTGQWAALMRKLHLSEACRGGSLVCAPLHVRSEVLGVLLLGERVGGAPYPLQDFDLLKSISDQAAASVLNLQLAQRLSQAKQLEAFQTMSAFFVHDMKNTASTLSLMLQNLPLHFNDPDFRADALRGISKTVAHINDLIRRLRLLRENLALQTVETDLNELVSDALSGLSEAPPAELVKELRPLPKIHADPEQIRNVVANLVLNARDAIGNKGKIRVETSQRNGWVILGVSDSGCGMTRDFVQRLLFRPFQTTKKNGIGIGMFQCKMIVEAHRGKIEVDSEVGKGTAFRVLLPVLQGQLA